MAGVQSSLFFVLCTFLRIFQSSYGAGDPCSDYKSINDPYRSSKYKLVAGEKAICDNTLASGWYRFINKVGGKMPTTKPEPYHCGTVAPIWMKGTHPTTKGEVIQALACTNINNRRGGCGIPKPMFVKNCGEFFVYELQPSGGRAMAYCAGNLLPCPRSQTGIVPNCRESVITPFPSHLVPVPSITYLENNEPLVPILCKFQFPLWKNVSFYIEWFTDGHSVKNDTICANQDPDDKGPACNVRQSALTHGHYQAEHRVRCRLRMKYTTNPKNSWTAFWRYDNEGTTAEGPSISISNHGEQRSSRKKRFLSYDFRCIACNNASNCPKKNESCLIGGQCFAANESNPRDWCQQCLPGDSVSSWTPRKGNHPPKFAPDLSTRYAIQGEYLPLQLQATDPDNRPVTYSLISTTATGYTFSSTGLLKWNVTSQYNKQFVFRVTDECNASDTMTTTLAIVPCTCQNGGKCLPDSTHPRGSGHYTCECLVGFKGPKCEEDNDDCITAQCVNGTCVDGVNNYTCRCHVGFTGFLCDQRLTRCTNQTCYPGVSCTEISNGISCGPCPVGFSGDGKTCVAAPTTNTPSTTTATPTAVTTTSQSTTTTAPTTTSQPTTTTAPTTTTTTPPTITRAPPTTTKTPPATADALTTTTTAGITTTAPRTTTSAPPTAVASTTRQPTTARPLRTSAASQITTEQGEITTHPPTTQALTNKTLTEETKDSLTTTQLPGTKLTTSMPAERVVKKCEIRILQSWVEEYSDVTSSTFDDLAILLWKEIWAAFIHAKNNILQKVVVTKLRKGSVIAEFDLTFKSEPEEPLKPIRERIKDGKLGELEVDSDSLRIRDEKTEDEPVTKDDTLVLTIVLVFISIFVIIIIVVVVIVYKRRQKRSRNLRRIRKKKGDEDGTAGETIPLAEKNSSK